MAPELFSGISNGINHLEKREDNLNTASTNPSSHVRNWSAPGETSSSTQTPAAAGGDSLANKEVFLQLLVSQIKNQNPLSPMDGVEFLGQLSQFTQVEQTLGMRQDLAKILTAVERGNATAATAGSGGQP